MAATKVCHFSQASPCAYIGRVGALAVALGVGMAIATPGVATASPDAESSTDSTGLATAATDATNAGSIATPPSSTVSSNSATTTLSTTGLDDGQEVVTIEATAEPNVLFVSTAHGNYVIVQNQLDSPSFRASGSAFGFGTDVVTFVVTDGTAESTGTVTIMVVRSGGGGGGGAGFGGAIFNHSGDVLP